MSKWVQIRVKLLNEPTALLIRVVVVIPYKCLRSAMIRIWFWLRNW